MMVSYTYRSDDPGNATGEGGGKRPEMKTFSFYTVVNLGTIIPRPGMSTATVEE